MSSMDGKPVTSKDSVGYNEIPNLIKAIPATQTGIVPDFPSAAVASQSPTIDADPTLMADDPWQSAPGDPVHEGLAGHGGGNVSSPGRRTL
jgi:hypothetical protein